MVNVHTWTAVFLWHLVNTSFMASFWAYTDPALVPSCEHASCCHASSVYNCLWQRFKFHPTVFCYLGLLLTNVWVNITTVIYDTWHTLIYITLQLLFMFFFTHLPFFWAGWLSFVPLSVSIRRNNLRMLDKFSSIAGIFLTLYPTMQEFFLQCILLSKRIFSIVSHNAEGSVPFWIQQRKVKQHRIILLIFKCLWWHSDENLDKISHLNFKPILRENKKMLNIMVSYKKNILSCGMQSRRILIFLNLIAWK